MRGLTIYVPIVVKLNFLQCHSSPTSTPASPTAATRTRRLRRRNPGQAVHRKDPWFTYRHQLPKPGSTPGLPSTTTSYRTSNSHVVSAYNYQVYNCQLVLPYPSTNSKALSWPRRRYCTATHHDSRNGPSRWSTCAPDCPARSGGTRPIPSDSSSDESRLLPVLGPSGEVLADEQHSWRKPALDQGYEELGLALPGRPRQR